MQTKKFLLILMLSIGFMINGLFAQGSYVILNTGYGFGMGSQTQSSFSNISNSGHSVIYEQINLSYGKGLNIGGSFGHMLNKNMGFELGISYLIGDKTTANQTNIFSSGGSSTIELSSDMLRINPSVVISSGMVGINPYAKFGVLVGLGSINRIKNYNSESYVATETFLLNGSLALGMTASLGATLKLANKIFFFGELAMVNMSYAPSKGEITAETYNGKDQLPSMTISTKKVDLVDTYTVSSQIVSDAEPSKQLKQKYAFGSLGLNIGLKFDL